MVYFCFPGTDATHAEHIETIKNRNYVGVQGDGTFLPGMLGMGLVEGEWIFMCVCGILQKNLVKAYVFC